MSFRHGMVYGAGRLFLGIFEPVLLMLCPETTKADCESQQHTQRSFHLPPFCPVDQRGKLNFIEAGT
jgi:hypothetical protein